MEDDADMCCSNESVPGVSDALKRLEGVRDALDMLCECFLVRANDTDVDPLWRRFYRVQMCSYLIAKRNLSVTPPEGDMVHDLIRDVWDGVKEYMETSKFGPVSNVEQWFKTIHIDFPVDPFDCGCTFFDPSAEGKLFFLCQNDTKKELKDRTV